MKIYLETFHFLCSLTWRRAKGMREHIWVLPIKNKKKLKSLIITWYLTQGLWESGALVFTVVVLKAEVWSLTIYLQPCPVLWIWRLHPVCRSQYINYIVYKIMRVGKTEQEFLLKWYFWLLWMVSCKVPHQTPFACARHFPPHIQTLRRKFQLTLLFFLFICLNILKEFFFFWVLLWIGHNSL